MPGNRVAENVLGTIGTICWTIQLLPQIWKSWRTKSTEGLSHLLVLLWAFAGVFLGIYAIVQNLNIPLIVQPQLFGFLCMVSWTQCQYYGRKWPLSTCLIVLVTFLLIMGGFEAGMVFAVKPSFKAGNTKPTEFFGILSTVFISLALLPQYYEIWKHKEVIGISVTFMSIDALGGVFSDLSLAFKPKFDVVAGVAYTLVVVLDGVVIILALILNPLAKKRRAREAEAQTATNPTQTLHVDSSGVTMTTPGDLTQGNLGTNRSPPPLSPLSVPDNVMIDSARQAFDRTDSTDCKTKGEVITLPSDLGAKV